MNKKIAVIGLGYVGLPLAQLFATKYQVIGYDIDENRISELRQGTDRTLEIETSKLKKVLVQKPSEQTGLFCTNKLVDIASCNYYIVTVPTPVDAANKPVLSHLLDSSRAVGKVLKKGDVVIFESTVYPGATEEECVPILEKTSGLSYNIDFFVGYSPERINPGDNKHTIDKILKVTSGSSPESAKLVNSLYASVVKAGTYLAPSIKVAEAAKVIENSQRDINIAFVNELAKIFNLMGIDTHAVLEAAGTKWNFLPFKPGLVGGHCIGVDPYYLAQKAQEFGYNPEIILAGRKMNDQMGLYVASEVIKHMLNKDIIVKESKILVLGITFKENCSDVRNSKVVDLIKNLQEFGANVSIYDPIAIAQEVKTEYDLKLSKELPKGKFQAVVVAVAHKEFLDLNFDEILSKKSILYDVKGIIPNIANASL